MTISIITDTVKSMYKHTEDVYNAVDNLLAGGGASLPENKNLENLVDAIDALPKRATYDPNNPSLEGLKAALNAGDYNAFPVGTEIPDEYNGQSNPLIVAQQLDSTNNSSYGGAEGVILVRKYVEPTSQQFGSSVNYSTSTIKNFLDTTYYNNCNNSLKEVISDIDIPYYDSNSSTISPITSKFFLMSAYEVCNTLSRRSQYYEGIMWSYWQEKTGLSSPDAMNKANSGRAMKARSGASVIVWLRSAQSMTNVGIVQTSGSIYSYRPDSGATCGVLPACFIEGVEPDLSFESLQEAMKDGDVS